MKTAHLARLIDRYVIHDRVILRVQTDRGIGLDVHVPDDLRHSAARYRGGDYVRYIYRGGRAYYARGQHGGSWEGR